MLGFPSEPRRMGLTEASFSGGSLHAAPKRGSQRGQGPSQSISQTQMQRLLGRLNNGASTTAISSSLEPMNTVPYVADVIELKVLRWRDYPGSSRWPDIITKALVRERQGDRSQRRRCNHGKRGPRGRERFEDPTLMVLEMEEGATRQGTQADSRNWKRQGNRLSPRASGRNAALPAPWCLASDLGNDRLMHLCCFRLPGLWEFVNSSNRKLIQTSFVVQSTPCYTPHST